MARAVMTRAIVSGVAAAVLAATVMASEPAAFDAPEPLALSATPIPLDPGDPARRTVGRLQYRGGLVLRSSNGHFGGLSGLRAGRDGWLIGVTDTGAWVTFRPVLHGRHLAGVTGGVIAPIRDDTGRSSRAKSDFDAEGLEFDPATGAALISLERDHRVLAFRGIDPARPATLGRAVATVRDPATAAWPSNGGGEGIATLTGGDRLIFEEEGRGASDVLRVSDKGTRVLRYTPPDGYRPTDAVELSPGVLLVLNRRYTVTAGVSAVLTLVPVADAMQGTEIARLAPPLNVDNMEGLALVRDGDRTFIYVVSDDNFNALQRTLLLRFELLPGGDKP